jgi:mono/diheme cytochrome c family protein
MRLTTLSRHALRSWPCSCTLDSFEGVMTLPGTKSPIFVVPAGVAIVAAATCLAVSGWLATPLFAQASAKNPPFETIVKQTGGPELYAAYCAVCHGRDGKGNGPVAKQLKPKVPDLTTIAKRNGGRFPMDKVQAIIAGTATGDSAHGSREMPIWGPVFSQIEWEKDLGKVRINNLARYLESLQVK